jgi:alginate O-acetyltransferase complex protein AlgI
MTDMNTASTLLGDLPRWAIMWLTIGGLFFLSKVAVLRGSGLRGWKLAGFTFFWAGMDAAPFHDGARKWTGRILPLLGWPLINTLLGAALLWGLARHMPHPLAAGWIGMAGLILTLHFGLLGLLAVAWRALGVAVTPIMRFPIAATSLADFWGRRWNLPFRDLAHRFIFKPVARRAGHKAALWAVFIVSGLVHELVNSVPAGAGYGLPTAYFLLQALGITLERKRPAPAWLRTHAFTVLPAFILFHPPFVERVLVPFFRVIGALP